MRGFKAFNPDMTCRRMQYEVGGEYSMSGAPILCERGFHFCDTIAHCFDYYSRHDSIVCEVEATGAVVDDGGGKFATNRLRVLRVADSRAVNMVRYGNGYGNGYGYGDGYGYGYGDGNGYGYGDGNGYGYGYGLARVAVME